MSDLENGDILEKGCMLDFDDGLIKPYEEVWRDRNADDGDIVWATETASEGFKGSAIRIGKLCQAILKRNGGTSSGRWSSNGQGDWELVFSSGSYPWAHSWPSLVEDGIAMDELTWSFVER